MRKALKNLAILARPILLLSLQIFYEKKYLKGRHFEISFSGYIFALRSIWQKNILRLDKPMPWPTALTCKISNPNNISFHPDDLNNFQSPGTYYQNFNGRILIGQGSYIAPNVGIITANHCLENLDDHCPGEDVVIGANCWIGMNSVIMPGVTLGNHTIVAAGAVVTKSFPQGKILIGGIPAKILKQLNI